METRDCSNNLVDENNGIKASAIIEMGRTGNRDSVEYIAAVLENEEEVDWVRACAAIALGKLSDGELNPSLLLALAGENQIVSRAAVLALGETGNQEAVPHLEEILKDKNKEDLHPVIINSIGKIGGSGAIPILLQALENSNDLVRVNAALVIRDLRNEELLPHFLKLIKDNNESLRAIAASSLGLTGDKSAVPPLLDALDDEAASVRAIAASSLGCIADSSVSSHLEKALGDENEVVRRQAAAAISKLKSRKP